MYLSPGPACACSTVDLALALCVGVYAFSAKGDRSVLAAVLCAMLEVKAQTMKVH